MANVRELELMLKKTGELLTITEDATVTEAAKKMSDNRIGCVIVFDKQNKFAGILSERDMLAKITTNSLHADSVLVKNIMTTNVVTCSRDTKIGDAEQLMANHKIRHIPIVEDDAPVGMISSRDIIAYQLLTNKAMKAAAEHIELLSTKLKGLSFEESTRLIMAEAPKSFEAESAVMCFEKKDSCGHTIYRQGCPLSDKELAPPQEVIESSRNGWAIYGKMYETCENSGGYSPRVVIPLDICKKSDQAGDDNIHQPGYLCMCRLNPTSENAAELQLHKASLLQEVLNVNLTNAKLYHDYKKARKESEIDPLTDVGTRRVLDKMLKVEHARAVRYKSYFSLAIFDLDNLKLINDSTGHATGDEVLRKIGQVINEAIRNVDLIARYGGDEFVLLMPETKLSGAEILLNRLLEKIRNISVDNVKSITASCGLAEWDGTPDDSIKKIFARADAALYKAKHNGRDCLVTSQATADTAV